jgi:hypothetical protein
MDELEKHMGVKATWFRNASSRWLPGAALLGALLLPASLPAGGQAGVRGPSSREPVRGPSAVVRQPVAVALPRPGATEAPYPSAGRSRQVVYRIRATGQGRGKGGG